MNPPALPKKIEYAVAMLDTRHSVEVEITQLHAEKQRCEIERAKLEEMAAQIAMEREEFEREKKLVEDANVKTVDQIQLNIGGEKITTTLSTLCSVNGTMLSAMFSGRHKLLKDKDGCYFIDRDAKNFKHVLNYLRNHKLDTPLGGTSSSIQDEFEYFCVPLPEEYRTKEKEGNDRKALLVSSAICNFRTLRFRWIEDASAFGYRMVTCGLGIHIVNIKSGKLERTLANSGRFRSVEMVANTVVAANSIDSTSSSSREHKGNIWMWDLNSGREVSIQAANREEEEILQVKLHNEHLLSCSADCTVQVWDLATGVKRLTMRGHDGEVECIDAAQHVLVSGGQDNTIRVWDLRDGTCLHTLVGHRGSVRCLKICDNLIVSGSNDATIKIWDYTKRLCLLTLYGHTNAVSTLNVLNHVIVSGSSDTTLRVWDMKTGRCHHTLEGHLATLRRVHFHSNKVITSVSADGEIKIWSAVKVDF